MRTDNEAISLSVQLNLDYLPLLVFLTFYRIESRPTKYSNIHAYGTFSTFNYFMW